MLVCLTILAQKTKIQFSTRQHKRTKNDTQTIRNGNFAFNQRCSTR